MTIYITANIDTLETFLIGGQINNLGNTVEGFSQFGECNESTEYLKTNGVYDIKKIKETIIYIIEDDGNMTHISEDGSTSFYHYGEKYKFKIPSEKNLDKLAKRILLFLTNRDTEKRIK